MTLLKKIISFIFDKVKIHFSDEKHYLRLEKITKNDSVIFCYFHDILKIDGYLIKHNIIDIFKNKNLQTSIFPRDLLIIGRLMERNNELIDELQMEVIDINSKKVTLKNKTNKITILISDLLIDRELVNQINRFHLIQIMSVYFPKVEQEKNISIKKECLRNLGNEKNNVVSLF